MFAPLAHISGANERRVSAPQAAPKSTTNNSQSNSDEFYRGGAIVAIVVIIICKMRSIRAIRLTASLALVGVALASLAPDARCLGAGTSSRAPAAPLTPPSATHHQLLVARRHSSAGDANQGQKQRPSRANITQHDDAKLEPAPADLRAQWRPVRQTSAGWPQNGTRNAAASPAHQIATIEAASQLADRKRDNAPEPAPAASLDERLAKLIDAHLVSRSKTSAGDEQSDSLARELIKVFRVMKFASSFAPDPLQRARPNKPPDTSGRHIDRSDEAAAPNHLSPSPAPQTMRQAHTQRPKLDSGRRHSGHGRLIVGRLAKKTDWNTLFVKLAKVFLQYFLDLILNDMFGTTGK